MARITEDYCDFETAKLLKEKGFDELCPTFYETDEPDNGPRYSEKLGWFLHNSYDYSDRYGKMIISAPTIQMTMKWLREVHNIALNVCYFLGMWSYSVYRTDVSSSGFNSEDFDTYEEACEAAIKYCLENLI